jgi:membrane protease YdiL (CAAX protease family)
MRRNPRGAVGPFAAAAPGTTIPRGPADVRWTDADGVPRAGADRGRAARARLGLFVLLAYALTWAWLLPLALSDALVEQGRGWPTHFPALLGPLLAALVVASRTGGLRGLLSRTVRVRIGLRWWAVALAPLGLLAIGLLVTGLTGGALPRYADFGVISGLPAAWGPGFVGLVVVLVNGFGEETGWRGYALTALQRRFGPLTAMLLLAVIWAGWHAPMFLVLGSFRDFGPAVTAGWLLGLAAGSIVLGWLANRTGSVPVVAVWHGLFTVVSGSAAATGTLAAVVSAGVMVWAVLLVGLELAARRRGRPPVLGPRP